MLRQPSSLRPEALGKGRTADASCSHPASVLVLPQEPADHLRAHGGAHSFRTGSGKSPHLIRRHASPLVTVEGSKVSPDLIASARSASSWTAVAGFPLQSSRPLWPVRCASRFRRCASLALVRVRCLVSMSSFLLQRGGMSTGEGEGSLGEPPGSASGMGVRTGYGCSPVKPAALFTEPLSRLSAQVVIPDRGLLAVSSHGRWRRGGSKILRDRLSLRVSFAVGHGLPRVALVLIGPGSHRRLVVVDIDREGACALHRRTWRGEPQGLSKVVVEQVDVDRKRERWAVVSEPSLDLSWVSTSCEESRRTGVSERVKRSP